MNSRFSKKFFVTVAILILFTVVVSLTPHLILQAQTTGTTKSLVMTYPKTREVWKKATSIDVRWKASGFKKANRVSVYLSKNNNPSKDKGDILIARSKPAYKEKAAIAPKALEKVEYGEYYVKIGYMPKGKPHIFSVSQYKVEIAKRPDPLLTITSPVGGEKWVAGSKQKITWTANFRKGLNKDQDTKAKYAGAKIVPTYGVDKGGASLDLKKIPEEDRAKILGLSDDDLLLLSRTDPDFLSLLDPTEASKITGLSKEGIAVLSVLSPQAYGVFVTLNFTSLRAFDVKGALKVVENVINPLSFATGSIFGDDEDSEPQTLSNTLYLQKKGSDTDIKLKKGIVEKGATTINLKKIEPGIYRLHIVSKLSKKFSLDSYSQYFTIVAPENPDDLKGEYISVVLPNSADDVMYTNSSTAIRWTTSFTRTTSKLSQIRLYSPTNEYVLQPTTTDMKNDGYESVKIPEYVVPGDNYKIEVTIKDGKTILKDSSDGSFKVLQGAIPQK